MTKAKAGRARAPTAVVLRRLDRDLADAERLMATGMGRLADTLLQEAVQRAPRSPDVHRLLAIGALTQGHAAQALVHAQAGGALAPHRADLVMLIGRAHKALSDLPQAIEAYRRAIRLDPTLAPAHVSLGIALKAAGDLEAAIASYRAALAIDADLAVAHSALGNALALQLTRSVDAGIPVDTESLAAWRRAVELDPGSPTAQHDLGVALIRTGHTEQAIPHLNVALALAPAREDTCILLHAALTKLNYLEDARACCERWLSLNPPTPSVTNRLVTVLLALNDIDAATRWAETARTLAPDMPEVMHNLALVCQQSLDVAAAVGHLRRAIDISPQYRASREVLLMSLNYIEEDPAAILSAHLAHAPRTVLPARGSRHRTHPGGRVRIGYVSGDLRRHSVAYFMEPVLAAHDGSRFEITAYSTGHDSDEVTQRLKACTTAWVEAQGWSDDDLAQRIRDDGIDVLVDLSGHTADGRLGVFARRPAPVQITYLGYPTTTGVGAMDYRISDDVIDPVGSDTWSSETILRCARGMFCYRPDAEPEVGALPALRHGHVTFGSFNNLAKLSPQTLALWSRVLHRVPESRLLLKSKALSSSTVRSRLLQQFDALGIGGDRLVLNPWRADLHGHLDMYREVDIGLDCFPFNGATTTCESLWMGVPVVSLSGATHVSRMGASILRSAGFSGWTASQPDEFVELAARHAGDLQALARLRSGARDRLRCSALMDAPAHTADLERLFLAACDRRRTPSADHRDAA